MAKVSVIIPTHNRPQRLANAIRSVLAQTEKDLEIFVVDDGSDDDAAERVVLQFNDRRVRYVRVAHPQGPAAARNVGLIKSAAPYVAFLDDDDEWLPEKLERQLSMLARDAQPVGVYTARFTIDERRGTTTATRFPGRFLARAGRNIVTTSSILLKRSCFDVVGLFDEALFVAEDFDMWIRIAERFDLIYLDEPLVTYFVHSGYRLTEDDAVRVRSQERFLQKHGHLLQDNRRWHCLEYIALGQRYRRLGEFVKARRALRRAIWLWPFEPRSYWVLARAVLFDSAGVAKRTARLSQQP